MRGRLLSERARTVHLELFYMIKVRQHRNTIVLVIVLIGALTFFFYVWLPFLSYFLNLCISKHIPNTSPPYNFIVAQLENIQHLLDKLPAMYAAKESMHLALPKVSVKNVHKANTCRILQLLPHRMIMLMTVSSAKKERTRI